MKRILFLGGPVFQIPIINKAKEMGLHVGIVDINHDAPASRYADEKFICSVTDKERVLEIASAFSPDAIICGACDTSVPTSAYVSQRLGLTGHTEDVAYKATNKLAMIQAFADHNVPHPAFQFVKKHEIDDFILDIPYPVISKPTDSAGSRGVCKINDEAALMNSVRESSAAGYSGDVLIEEYMEGPEVSVEVLVVGDEPTVLQITDKLTSGAPHFYEIGHVQPSALSESTKQRISELAKNAVRAVGIVNSPAHVEMRITNEGPKLIELGARMGGDCISTYLIDNSIIGINMSEMAIRLALGEHPVLPVFHNNVDAVAVRFIPSVCGRVTNICNVDAARKVEAINMLDTWCEIGKHYDGASNNSGRFGFVVAKGKTCEEALSRCQKAIDTISIIIE